MKKKKDKKEPKEQVEKKTVSDVIREAHDNACKDRELIVERLKMILDVGGNGEAWDPPASERIARLADCLSKANAQLVELAKLEAKREMVRQAKSKGVDIDAEAVYGEIGDPLMPSKDEIQ